MGEKLITALCVTTLLMCGCSGSKNTTNTMKWNVNPEKTTEEIVGEWKVEYDGNNKDLFWNDNYDSLKLTSDGCVYDENETLIASYKESDGYIGFYDTSTSELSRTLKYEIDDEILKIADLRDSDLDPQLECPSQYSGTLVGYWVSGNDSLQFDETGWIYINESKEKDYIFKVEDDHLTEYQIVDGSIQNASLMKYEVSDTELKIVDFFESDNPEKWTSYEKMEAALTEEDALAIAEDLVEKTNTISNYSIVCDLDFDNYLEYDQIYDYLSAEQKNYYIGYFAYRSTCCNSIQEVKDHLHKYFDDEVLEGRFFEDMLIQADSKVYTFIPVDGRGGIAYMNVSLESFDNDHIVAFADLIGSDGSNNGTYQFDIEKNEGTYKLKNISEYQATVDSSEKDSSIEVTLTWTVTDVDVKLGLSVIPNNGQSASWKNNELSTEDGTVLAVSEEGINAERIYIKNENAHYTLTVENPSYGTSGNFNVDSLGANVVIKKNGNVVFNQVPTAYRSYTGYWFGGICEIINGEISAYDASWIG